MRWANALGLPFDPADLDDFETPRYRIGPRQRHTMVFVEGGKLRAWIASFGFSLSAPLQKPLVNNARSDAGDLPRQRQGAGLGHGGQRDRGPDDALYWDD